MSHTLEKHGRPTACGARPATMTLEQQIEELRRQLQIKRAARARPSGLVPFGEDADALRRLGPRFHDTLWGESDWSPHELPVDAGE